MNVSPSRFNPWALFPLLAGLAWLQGGDGWRWLLVLAPGLLLTASGVSMLLWPGDSRITRFMALGGLFGLILGLFWWASTAISFAALLLSAAAFLIAGRESLRSEPEVAGVPSPSLDLSLSAKAALDEALLAYFVGTADVPGGEKARATVKDMQDMHLQLRERGLLDQPEKLHRNPTAPESVQTRSARIYGVDYQVLSFDSEFQPELSLPGGDRWASYTANRHTAAWVKRHEGEDRPWLVCVHGYRMGVPWMDMNLFPPRILHEKLGLNLLMPVLPLHGPRRAGLRSGDHFLDGDMTDLVHAESHALWDLRRHLAWLRAQGATRIGVIGFSLGGYNAALLAQYERDLDFVIAAIPVADFASTLWGHLSPANRAYYEREGCSEALLRDCLSVVAPLSRPPLLAADRRFVFGGMADRLVPPAEVAKLARHWGVAPAWYNGGHLTFRGAGIVRDQLHAAMRVAGWTAPEA
jgi:hypothetical protein